MSKRITRSATEKQQREENFATLEDFGYKFNIDGKLVDDDDAPFKFDVYQEHARNQKRYERLGEVIEEHVYHLLEENSLEKKNLPLDVDPESEPYTFVFKSSNADTCDKLMILIHGSGVVRAGQWARRLIINHSLESGTQIPYIKRAMEQGFGVVVLNTNDNRRDGQYIRENDSPHAHGLYVWENLIRTWKAKHIAIVAHSAGGAVTTYMLESCTAEFKEKVFAIGFTDSVHSTPRTDDSTLNFFKKVAQNWVSSDKPLGDQSVGRYNHSGCPLVSAGTSKHEETSWKAKEEVFKFINKLYDERMNSGEPAVKKNKEGDNEIEEACGVEETDGDTNNESQELDETGTEARETPEREAASAAQVDEGQLDTAEPDISKMSNAPISDEKSADDRDSSNDENMDIDSHDNADIAKKAASGDSEAPVSPGKETPGDPEYETSDGPNTDGGNMDID